MAYNPSPFGEESFIMVNQQELARLLSRGGPNESRLIALALSRANLINHAEFEPSEIGGVLDVKPSTVTGLIARCKEMGYLTDESCTRCLVVNPWLVVKRAKGNRMCAYHGVVPPRLRSVA